MAIAVKLDDLLHARRMTLTELAERVGITHRQPVDPEDRQGARDPLLDARGDLRGAACQPGDILEFLPDAADERPRRSAEAA